MDNVKTLAAWSITGALTHQHTTHFISKQFEVITKTLRGLEEVLAGELIALGANDVQIGCRVVSFTGDGGAIYKANFCLRIAIHTLKPIEHFTARDTNTAYEQIKTIRWEEVLDIDKAFAIDAVVFSDEFRHSEFVSYKAKDAIVDYSRELNERRPSVCIDKPDVLLNIHIAQTTCTLPLDSSGESLHREGYRQETVEAPLNEVLAAGVVLMTGQRDEYDLIDSMCSSGIIPIEATLIAHNIAPEVFRKELVLEGQGDFNQDLSDRTYNDDDQEREFTYKIYGYDNGPKTSEITTRNVKAAGAPRGTILKLQPFQQFERPAEESIITTDPPYGERISTNGPLGLCSVIGECLKHAFVGNDAWVLSYREKCSDRARLKLSVRTPLSNDPLGCKFRKYQIFDGKYKEFKNQGGSDEDSEHAPRERREFRPRRKESGFGREGRLHEERSSEYGNKKLREFKRNRKSRVERPRED